MENNSKYIWLIDNGHGSDTAGKRSPVWTDMCQLFEYKFNRIIAGMLIEYLSIENFEYRLLVPETTDISLHERVRRANEISINNPDKICIVISIHGNAAGVESASGVEVFTSPGETKSDKVASIFLKHLEGILEWKMRFDHSDGDPDKEAKFYILTKTKGPAILTESGFYTNKEECKKMLDPIWQKRIAKAHYLAIRDIELAQNI